MSLRSEINSCEAYTVLQQKDPAGHAEPWVICRVTVFFGQSMESQMVEPIARHHSRNLACYWAHMLNVGSESEESVRQKIEEQKHV